MPAGTHLDPAGRRLLRLGDAARRARREGHAAAGDRPRGSPTCPAPASTPTAPGHAAHAAVLLLPGAGPHPRGGPPAGRRDRAGAGAARRPSAPPRSAHRRAAPARTRRAGSELGLSDRDVSAPIARLSATGRGRRAGRRAVVRAGRVAALRPAGRGRAARGRGRRRAARRRRGAAARRWRPTRRTRCSSRCTARRRGRRDARRARPVRRAVCRLDARRLPAGLGQAVREGRASATAGLSTPDWVALPHATFPELGAAAVLDADRRPARAAADGQAGPGRLRRWAPRWSGTPPTLPAAMVGCFAYGDDGAGRAVRRRHRGRGLRRRPRATGRWRCRQWRSCRTAASTTTPPATPPGSTDVPRAGAAGRRGRRRRSPRRRVGRTPGARAARPVPDRPDRRRGRDGRVSGGERVARDDRDVAAADGGGGGRAGPRVRLRHAPAAGRRPLTLSSVGAEAAVLDRS